MIRDLILILTHVIDFNVLCQKVSPEQLDSYHYDWLKKKLFSHLLIKSPFVVTQPNFWICVSWSHNQIFEYVIRGHTTKFLNMWSGDYLIFFQNIYVWHKSFKLVSHLNAATTMWQVLVTENHRLVSSIRMHFYCPYYPWCLLREQRSFSWIMLCLLLFMYLLLLFFSWIMLCLLLFIYLLLVFLRLWEFRDPNATMLLF